MSWPPRCPLSLPLCAYGFNSYLVRAKKGSRKASQSILLFLQRPSPISFSQQTGSSRPVKCVFTDLVKQDSQCRSPNSVKTVQSKHCREIHQGKIGTVSEWEVFFFCLVFEFCIGRGVFDYIFNGDREGSLSSRMWAVVSK